MKNILCFIVLLYFGWVTSQDKVQVESPVIAAKVPIGKAITIDGITIFFKAVTEDSRCPLGVTCIWAGRAKVIVEVKSKGQEIQKKEIIFGQTIGGEIADNTVYDYGDSSLRAFSIEPYPKYEKITDVTNYTLLVYKEKK